MQVWIIVYVDDLIIASNTIESQEKIIEFLQSQFRMKYIGVPKMFLGINITHLPESKSMLLTQWM